MAQKKKLTNTQQSKKIQLSLHRTHVHSMVILSLFIFVSSRPLYGFFVNNIRYIICIIKYYQKIYIYYFNLIVTFHQIEQIQYLNQDLKDIITVFKSIQKLLNFIHLLQFYNQFFYCIDIIIN